jgi:hypothetical protein
VEESAAHRQHSPQVFSRLLQYCALSEVFWLASFPCAVATACAMATACALATACAWAAAMAQAAACACIGCMGHATAQRVSAEGQLAAPASGISWTSSGFATEPQAAGVKQRPPRRLCSAGSPGSSGQCRCPPSSSPSGRMVRWRMSWAGAPRLASHRAPNWYSKSPGAQTSP